MAAFQSSCDLEQMGRRVDCELHTFFGLEACGSWRRRQHNLVHTVQVQMPFSVCVELVSFHRASSASW